MPTDLLLVKLTWKLQLQFHLNDRHKILALSMYLYMLSHSYDTEV